MRFASRRHKDEVCANFRAVIKADNIAAFGLFNFAWREVITHINALEFLVSARIFTHLIIKTFQQRITAISLYGFHAHPRKDTRKFRSDITASNNQNGLREFIEQEGIIGHDGMFAAFHLWHPWAPTNRDKNILSRYLFAAACQAHRMGINKFSALRVKRRAIAVQNP